MFVAIAVLTMLPGVGSDAACAMTLREVAAGEHVSADMVELVACEAERRGPPLRFDRMTRSMVAQVELPAGTYLGRLHAPPASVLPKGSRLTLRSVSGPAIIEREVVTLQPASTGQRVFVRDAGGNVFAVALVLPGQGAVGR